MWYTCAISVIFLPVPDMGVNTHISDADEIILNMNNGMNVNGNNRQNQNF